MKYGYEFRAMEGSFSSRVRNVFPFDTKREAQRALGLVISELFENRRDVVVVSAKITEEP